MILTVFTLVHVAISLVGIVAGMVVLRGLLNAKRLDRWTVVFLASTVLTSVTGFLFPFHGFLPSHGVAIVSLVILPVAVFARYRRGLIGRWRPAYVITAMTALYLNVFVLGAQTFQKVPPLKALAPTQSEPPFAIAQLVVLAAFVAFTILAVVRFRPG